jgi:ABC-type sugar transport system ATPase subunit
VSSPARTDSAGGVTVGVRPEHLRIDPAGTLDVTVDIVEQLGAEDHVIGHLADASRLVIRQDASRPAPEPGAAVRVMVDGRQVHLFDAGSGSRLGGPG